MNLLSVEDISKSYGEKVLFKSISFGINKGQKIALIAKNGTGKTSILDIIVGKDNPDTCLLYTSPSPRDGLLSRMPSSA